MTPHPFNLCQRFLDFDPVNLNAKIVLLSTNLPIDLFADVVVQTTSSYPSMAFALDPSNVTICQGSTLETSTLRDVDIWHLVC